MFTISESLFIGVNEIKQHYFLVCGEGEIKIRFFLKWVINSPCVKKNNKKRNVCVKKMNNNKTTESLGNRTLLEITGEDKLQSLNITPGRNQRSSKHFTNHHSNHP